MFAIYFTRAFAFLRSHLLLVITGLCCEAVYVAYFVGQMPLVRYYSRLTDLGGITNHSQIGFLIYTSAFLVLFCLFCVAWWDAHRHKDRTTLWLILGFGALFAVTMAWVYPVTAIDIYTYIADSLVWVQYHANLTVVPPSQYPYDPLMRLAGGWAWLPAPYGPLCLLIDALPTAVAGRNLLLNLLLLKYILSGIILLEAYLAYKILRHLSPRLAISGAVFIAWNPFLLFEYSANGHNDIVMMLFVLLGILALVKNRPLLAVTLITASALVKYSMALLIPLFLIYTIWQQPTLKKRLQFFLLAATSSLGLVVILYAPFWHGIETLSATLYQDRQYLTSFSATLNFSFSNQISLEQGKLLGRSIFMLFYLYALFFSTRHRLQDLLFGAFLSLFFFQAFALATFNSWYGIWSMMLAVLVPITPVWIAALLFAYGTTVSVGGFQFGLTGFGFTSYNWGTVSTFGYLVTFTPAMLILLGLALIGIFKGWKDWHSLLPIRNVKVATDSDTKAEMQSDTSPSS